MAFRSLTTLFLVVPLSGCGGATPASTQKPGTSGTPAATQGGQPTPAGTVSGGPIDSDAVAAALTALQGVDSWTFEVKTWVKSLGTAGEQDVRGTERRTPAVAIDAKHHSDTGDFEYIRIGDDIWTNLGTNTFYHYDAADSANLISQYEPFYVAGLVADAAGSQTEYNPVGVESVNGVSAMHYTLSDSNREKLTELSGLEPSKWAGDVWIAADGGWLVKFAWGPQTLEDAQPIMGFLYDTTSTNCACPINAPTNVASP